MLSAKFLVGSLMVIDTVGFFVVFCFTRTTIKVPLNFHELPTWTILIDMFYFLKCRILCVQGRSTNLCKLVKSSVLSLKGKFDELTDQSVIQVFMKLF